MHVSAKMREIPPKFGEYSYEVKCSLGEWRFWPNGIISNCYLFLFLIYLFFLIIFADQVFIDPTFFVIFVCGPLQSLVINVSPLRDFGQNGKYCEHPPVLGKIQMRWQKGPLKVVIFTKMANKVRIRQSLSYKSNKTDRIQTLRIGEGEGGGGLQNNVSALRASVWSKNKRGAGPPGPPPDLPL